MKSLQKAANRLQRHRYRCTAGEQYDANGNIVFFIWKNGVYEGCLKLSKDKMSFDYSKIPSQSSLDAIKRILGDS